MKFDKKEIFKGLFIGFISTLLICSICKVTFYGLDYAVSVSSIVIGKNLLYMFFASIIAFFIVLFLIIFVCIVFIHVWKCLFPRMFSLFTGGR